MNKRFQLAALYSMLAIAMVSCAPPIANGGTQPSVSDEVATIVAMTMQAITPEAAATPTNVPEASTSWLPHSLYYLSSDDTGLTQIFHIERDATTEAQPLYIDGTQFTFESVNVSDYDVSLVDGSLVYAAGNQLLLVNADGSNRRVLLEGDNGSAFNNPVFSPDGKTIAYGYKGLNFYTLDTGISSLVFEDQFDTNPSGGLMARELYWPEKYSPDGTKLIITLQHFESADAAIYDPAANTLIRLNGDPAVFCCEDTEWSFDSSSFYGAVPRSGVDSGGLWRVDSSTGAVTTLLSLSILPEASDVINYADEPYLAPDGFLYFFLVNHHDFLDRRHLQLVRSSPEDVTKRTVLSTEDFQLMTEALWAPDASLVVVVFAPVEEVYQGAQTEIIYLDGRQSRVMTRSGHDMKWGP